MQTPNLLSFVIPCYGSEKTIEFVVEEIIRTVAERPEWDYEIICVNDCSPDGVFHVLRTLENDKITVIDLAKNVGKQAAVLCGYRHVRGSLIVDIDDDGQCPVDKLWSLVDRLGDDADIVYAAYPKKKQSAFKNFGSRLNSFMAHVLLDKPKSLVVSNFSVKRRFITDTALRYQNPFPYPLGFYLLSTDRFAGVPMEERDRYAGRGGFTFRKSLALWMNGFTAFSVKPLRLATTIGALFAFGGFIYGLYLVIEKLFFKPDMQMGYASTMSAIWLVGGVIMLMIGMVGEYVGRIYMSANNLPQYVVRQILGGEKNEEEIE